ncbi:MAG: AsmA-like C-terminal domain-containing protein [Nitrospira sp.]|nr:AsmA-like C-terminal domain-containing protein [Nitrospira sp.]
MSHFRLSLLIVLSLVVLVGAFLAFSRELIGQDYLKDFVLEQLEEGLGRKIDVRRVRLVVFPSIRAELLDVAIHAPQSEQVVLTAKRVDLVLRLGPLLKKQVVGKRLLIEEPVLALRRNEDGRWNIFDGESAQADTDLRTMNMMAGTFRIKEAKIANGMITVIDAARTDGIRSAKLDHVEFSMVIRPDRGLAELHASVRHQGAGGVSTLSLNGVVKGADASVSLTGEEAGEPPSGYQFEGQIEVADLRVREAADFLGPRPVSEQLQGALNLRSSVRVLPGIAGYDMVLSDMTARLSDIALTGHANLAGLLTPQPTFSVTFSSAPVAVRKLVNTIPPDWISPRLPAFLADHQIDGSVQAVRATLTGSTMTGQHMLTTGEFRVRDGQGVIGRDRTAVQDLAAVVMVETGRVRITKVTGTYGAMQLTDGKADVSFLEKGPMLALEVTGEMAVAPLVEFLGKTVKTELVLKILAGIHNLEGIAEGTFRLVGPLDRADQITFEGGEITARQVSLSHVALPERLTGIQGRFILTGGSAQLEEVVGHLGETALQVQGMITGGTTSLFQDFVIHARGDASQLERLFRSTAIEQGVFEGTLSSTVVLSGSTSKPQIKGSFAFDEAKVVLGSLEKPIGARATVEFDGILPPRSGVTLDRVELVLPRITIPAKGTMHLGDRFRINMAIMTRSLSMSSLPEWVSKAGLEAGNLDLSLDIKGKGTDWKAWRVTGWMGMTNGLMRVNGVSGQLQDLYARVRFARNEVDLKRLSFRLQDSDLALEATVRNWLVKPAITGKIESDQLDLSLVIPKGERSPMREFLETLAATSHVTMSASVARGHYRHMKLTALSARINIQDGVLDIDRLSGESSHGHVAGRLVAHLPPKAPADIDLSFRATGVEFDDLLRLTNAQIHGVSGEARLSGVLRGHGRNPHGIYPSLNGKIEVLLENGRVLKSNERAIWKIISLLNVPAVLQGKVDLEKEGLPYNRITATVAIQNGMFQTENLIIDSPILRITAAGNYDLPTDHLDLAVAVSPFGSYSQFLKTIPLFGRVIAGERKGLATAMFTMQGAMEDPKVTYLPVKSFASGLSGLAQLAVDVLTNTLTLPIDLVAPNEETEVKPRDLSRSPAPAIP